MAKRREKRAGRQADGASGATLSLEDAATQLGVPVETLLEALEESGIQLPDNERELRLEAAEVEKYRQLVSRSQTDARERLARLLDELE